MLEWLKLFPPYLIFLTVICVIIPTIASLFIRLSIYKYLNDLANKVTRLLRFGESPGIQPKIVSELEERYKIATHQLEQVNTAALIDGIYSQEKFKFLGFSLLCEQWDYFCRILPNLLLAFGLLGTFLGITVNLYNLSQTISGVENDVSGLVQQLQLPLQSMGIAFITSLVALLSSSFLIVINLRCNTNLAKYRLISALEDYLDNIFKPKVQGDSRLDKAVNRMVEQQHEFLIRFHEKVGEVMELTLGRAALKIAEENKIANSLAREVYERFLESSGTLSRSADTFQGATLLLDEQIKNLSNIVSHFKLLESSALTFQKSAEKIEQSKFSENLETLTVDLAKTQIKFTLATAQLEKHIGQIIAGNQEANQLAKQVYSQLQESSGKLQDSAAGFIQASEKIDKSQFADKLSAATKDLGSFQTQFSQSAATLSQSTRSLNKVITNLQSYAQKMLKLGDGIGDVNKQSINLVNLTEKRIANEEESLKKVISQLNRLIETIKNNEQKTQQELQTFGYHLSQSASNQSTQSLNKVITDLQSYAQEMLKLGDGIGDVNKQSINLVNLTEKRIANEEESLKKVISQLNRLIETIKNNEQKTQQELQTFGYHLSQSASNANQSNPSIYKALENLSTAAQKILELGDGTNNLNQKSVNLIQLIEKRIESDKDNSEKVVSQFNQLIETIVNNQQITQQQLQKLGDRFSQSPSNSDRSTSSFEQPVTDFQNTARKIFEFGDGISNLDQKLSNPTNSTNNRDNTPRELDELDLVLLRDLASYFERMPDSIRHHHRDHNASREEAEVIANYYKKTADIVRSVKNKNDLIKLITYLEDIKEKVSRYQHESYKYRWSTSLEKEVLEKLDRYLGS